jgi:hypothetical protein
LLIRACRTAVAQPPAQTESLAIGLVQIEKHGSHAHVHLQDFKLIKSSKNVAEPKPDIIESGTWMAVLLDQGKAPVDTIWMGTPLSQRLEYPASEQSGELTTTTKELHETSLLIRFSYKSNMKWVRFEQFAQSGKFVAVETVPLQIP